MVTPTPVNPPALGRPLGFQHAMRTKDLLFLAGQIGATPRPDGRHDVVPGGFAAQFDKALENVVAILAEAGLPPTQLVEMTIYVADMDAYRAARTAIGEAWKRRLGRHYPAMTVVAVDELFEPDALVEVRAIAALP